jgi:hypothetical protein
MDPHTPDDYFARSPLGLAVYRHVARLLASSWPDISSRTTKSQVAFRRGRAFAFLWRPQQYLRSPTAEVVLSIALPQRIESDRFKEVVHPTASTWLHHLEIHAASDVDEEVSHWLNAAADAAGPSTRSDRTGGGFAQTNKATLERESDQGERR